MSKRTLAVVESVKTKLPPPFETGRQKAQQEIANKWPVLNAPGKKVMEYKSFSIQDYGGGNFVVFTENGNGFAQTTQKSVEAAKSWIDAHPYKKPLPGSRVLEYGD